MKKREAIEIFHRDVEYVVEAIFEMVSAHRRSEHGGWEEVDEETADSMLTLGEDGSAKALRDAMVIFLQTPRGLTLVKEFQSPHYAWAKVSYGDEKDLD